MTDQSPEPYRKPALILGGVAVAGLCGALILGLLLAPEEFTYQTPAAMMVSALGIMGLLSTLGIAIVFVAAAIKQLEQSAIVSRTVTDIGRSVSELSRPKITTTAGMSTADELAKWADLRDKGVVSQDEFEVARAELLKSER